MKSIVNFAIWIALCVIGILVCFRIMGASLVYENAKIIMRDVPACPVAIDKDNFCVVTGSLSHELISGKAVVQFQNGANMVVGDSSIATYAVESQNVHFRPFGQIGTFLIVAAVWFLFSAVPIWLPLSRKLKRWSELSGTTKTS